MLNNRDSFADKSKMIIYTFAIMRTQNNINVYKSVIKKTFLF